jgi:hypothetical protein
VGADSASGPGNSENSASRRDGRTPGNSENSASRTDVPPIASDADGMSRNLSNRETGADLSGSARSSTSVKKGKAK